MVFGVPPFANQNNEKIQNKKLPNERLLFPGNIPVSDELKDLLCHMLQADPRVRLGWKSGLDEIKDHAWFIDIDSKSIQWDSLLNPNNRMLFMKPTANLINSMQDKYEELECMLDLI